MKVSLHVSVAIALIVGMGLCAQLDAQMQGATVSATTVTEQPAAAPPKADVSVRNAPVGTRDVATNPDEVYATNRKALEQRAGKDAAKLLLRSAPSEALIYIDGTPVGRAPLLLIVPPGKYKVEMRGPREGSAERLLGLLPNETQQVALTLVLKYPGKISVR
jgi:hypothetical protein